MKTHIEDINKFYDLVQHGKESEKREFAIITLKIIKNGNKVVFAHIPENANIIPEIVFDDLESIINFYRRKGINLSDVNNSNPEPDILTIIMLNYLKNANEIAERLFPESNKPIFTLDGNKLSSTVLTQEQINIVDNELFQTNWL